MRPAGAGALMQLLEERKKKLAAEGLFDPARKKPIPFLPRVIGVVTSPTGAVIRDILHRVRERFPVHVIVWPSLVQGEKAAEQVAAGIRGFNALVPGGAIPRPDVLIVARGGGSIEDLWPFNEEIVVRAAAASDIPLISAVGHETDTTLIDHASDRRAPTPTGAAEIAVPVRTELLTQVETLRVRMNRSLVRQMEKRRLEYRSAAGRMPRLEALLQRPRQRLDLTSQRFGGALAKAVARKRAKFGEWAGRLQPAALRRDLAARRREVKTLADRLQPALTRKLDRARQALQAHVRMLISLSHEGVLKRGFALVLRADGRLVRSSASISGGEALRLRLSDGEVAVVADAQSPPPAETIPGEATPSRPLRPRVVRRKATTGESGPADQGDLF
jgi:exodeoxyribonuclease VII large subunit